MSQATLPLLDVNAGDTVYDLETDLNLTIGQSVKSVAMNGSQSLRMVTQNGVNNECFITKARDGILSGCDFAFTGALAFTIAAGNWQTNGKTESLGVSTPLSFGARHATLPRIDLVYATVISPPSIAIIAGTASANPQPPTHTSVQAPLYLVWIDPIIVAVPQDFVLGSFHVDPPTPLDGAVSLSNGAITYKLPTTPRSGTFVVASPDFNSDYILVDTVASPSAITIPLPNPTNYEGRVWTFIDNGNANTMNIIFDATANGAFTINGASDITITTNYAWTKVIVKGGAFYAA